MITRELIFNMEKIIIISLTGCSQEKVYEFAKLTNEGKWYFPTMEVPDGVNSLIRAMEIIKRLDLNKRITDLL